jgi:integrase
MLVADVERVWDELARSSRRAIGSIRQLPSGRFSASVNKYGYRIPAPHTFEKYDDADEWCYQVAKKVWRMKHTPAAHLKAVPPRFISQQEIREAHPTSETLDAFGSTWLKNNNALRERTRYDYQRILDKWLQLKVDDRVFSTYPMHKIDNVLIRKWLAEVTKVASPSTADYSYRVLRAILNEAASQGIIHRPPAPIKKRQQIQVSRPIIDITQLITLASEVPLKFSLAVLIAGICGLRSGEIFGLRRKDINLENRTITVEQAIVSVPGKGTIIGPPKTKSSVRTISYPDFLHAKIEVHLTHFTEAGGNSLVFTTDSGNPVTVEERRSWWDEARTKTGLTELHFHDLRHLAATLAAQHGASLAELQARMGHSTVSAAMRYQHATLTRDKVVSASIDQSLRNLG